MSDTGAILMNGYMEIANDTGTEILPIMRHRRPLGSNRDHLDTGPYHDIYRTWNEQPHLKPGTVYRIYAPDGHNAGVMVQEASIIKRYRRGYPRWRAKQENQ
jgi:hypothetical protein